MLTAVSMANAATQVLFETNQGNFTVEVYADKAPKTVENFLQYVKDGFYTNTIFHRVIGRFMIQGGGFDRELNEKPTRAPVVNESNNGLLNATGTIAMARTPDPNSATAQFFVNVADNQFLDYTSPEPDRIGYCVFGKVISGMDVVFKISNLPTGNQRGFSDVPIRTVVIKRSSIINGK
ncbi:peptidylprolyl isomerase [Methylophilus methylotrophus]|uniref:peptidylprolyl isomerase n=1 Tax=Methylophilus methylotrophus TaxID=17 RepID=UPI000371C458